MPWVVGMEDDTILFYHWRNFLGVIKLKANNQFVFLIAYNLPGKVQLGNIVIVKTLMLVVWWWNGDIADGAINVGYVDDLCFHSGIEFDRHIPKRVNTFYDCFHLSFVVNNFILLDNIDRFLFLNFLYNHFILIVSI